MSVRIRLRRVGRKAQPHYRVVVADSATPRDGHYLDSVGVYNPRTNPAELRMDLEKVDAWLAKGADLSQTVASLVRKARRGGDSKVAIVTAMGASATSSRPAVESSAAEVVDDAAQPAEPEAGSAAVESASAEAEAAPAEEA